jgi:RNA polymerase sigma factor (sigma-70 family)
VAINLREVGAGAAVDLVGVPVASIDPVVARTAIHPVEAVAAPDHIAALAALQDVVSTPPLDPVPCAEAGDLVGAPGPDQLVGTGSALDDVEAHRFDARGRRVPGLLGQLGDLDPELASAERRATLSPLIGSLPEREQVMLYLRFYEGLTQSEIAKQLGISQMHVSRLLARSLQQLRELTEDS